MDEKTLLVYPSAVCNLEVLGQLINYFNHYYKYILLLFHNL